ncbi:serine hydrolase domain-containing protein [Streptomyces netropsis]|uniref:D-alanyl-D-alanine-carboxypeptidase/D-alanyl-D-alanine-endopeptidase n=1 Tax=Streptomyces netropsis TaxID=55404 RepID=A0A7W7PDC7_STRNE|nr:serine hydrolase [Streptomyces netropsis]MBB4885874.1 D-alanyl-D-alanine-carboxypeptidase/D-alanyl-D-alanine-endopeptidase [Streptomyces netropsis]GGR18094.1 hypothetical protein GCM10010219_24190 [Streptomyces netropsis]
MFRTPMCVLSSAGPPRAVHGHDPDRFVQIGSLTKVLTGTALMRMSHAGVLDADDPLERWLDVPSGTGITLRHLADHTSGLPGQPTGLPRRDPYLSFDDAALHAHLRRLEQLTTTPAGQSEEYSNLGYAVLGAALSAAAGKPCAELIHEYVLAPLNIQDVTADPPAERRLHATGLLGRQRKPWTMNTAIMPAGGMWATPRAAAEVVTKLVVDRELGPPAPSWQTIGRLVWHNGATKNASVFAGVLPDGRWLLIHRLGGSPDRTDKMGAQLLAQLPRG